MTNTDIYQDIACRMGGEIYIGVIGPVRTGKSTFIKNFMELMVIPNMEDEHSRKRALDELPLAASGRLVTTTEPKFIPKDEATVRLGEDLTMKIRMIDCVGYMVDGALASNEEQNEERMVRTPWFDYEIPFSQAAEIGTRKVINEHSGVGIIVTSDGSFGDLQRERFIEAETRTIREMKETKKPFLVLLNSTDPYSDETGKRKNEMEKLYGVTVMPMNIQKLRKDDVHNIIKQLLAEFPIVRIDYYMPKWVEMLPDDHEVKKSLISYAQKLLDNVSCMRQITREQIASDDENIKETKIEKIDLSSGSVAVSLHVDEQLYYEMLSNMIQLPVKGEYQLIGLLKNMASMKKEYEKVLEAMESVRRKGYGVVTPNQEEIHLDEPVLIKHGNKYGVKIKAESPSIHLIRANIETEIAPIVGDEQQAEELIEFIKESSASEEGIWNTSIFGKSIEQLVSDGIRGKILMMGEESQQKLQDTMQKIVNDSKGGLVCIII